MKEERQSRKKKKPLERGKSQLYQKRVNEVGSAGKKKKKFQIVVGFEN